MIIIEISSSGKKQFINVRGHEVVNENNNALICAAVSSYITIFANFISNYKVTQDDILTVLDPGNCYFEINNLEVCTKKIQFLYELLVNGLMLLAKEHYNSITII